MCYVPIMSWTRYGFEAGNPGARRQWLRGRLRGAPVGPAPRSGELPWDVVVEAISDGGEVGEGFARDVVERASQRRRDLVELLGYHLAKPSLTEAERMECEGLLEIVRACDLEAHDLSDWVQQTEPDPVLWPAAVELACDRDIVDADIVEQLVGREIDSRTRARIVACLIRLAPARGRASARKATHASMSTNDIVAAEIILDALCDTVWKERAGLLQTADFLRECRLASLANREGIVQLLQTRHGSEHALAERDSALFSIVHNVAIHPRARVSARNLSFADPLPADLTLAA